MSSLYERIEELQEMVKILASDVEYLSQRIGERSIQVDISKNEKSNRRFYIRAIFSLIEAVVEQYKRLLLDLEDRNIISLDPGMIPFD